MASDPSLAIQKTLVAELKELATAAGNNVFDMTDASSPFPRITVGPMDVVPVMADCYDGSETFVQIDVWSRKPGFPEAKTIADAIRTRFHRSEDFVIEGHTLELLFVESTIYQRDPDGLTSRARMSLRIQSQPSTDVESEGE